jgi:hypothetical protein
MGTEWFPVEARMDQIVCNIGDQLMRVSWRNQSGIIAFFAVPVAPTLLLLHPHLRCVSPINPLHCILLDDPPDPA